MVRDSRIWPNVYFGKPGALITLPYPRGDIDKTYERQTFDFVTGSGQHMISSSPAGSRPFSLVWNSMHVDNFKLIEQYSTGMMGAGPWTLIDPSARNLLLPNQASATNLYSDASDWKTGNNLITEGTLLSNTNATFIHRPGATRSIRWQFTTGPISLRPTLVPISPYRNWNSFPVLVGLPYTFSVWICTDGVIDVSIGALMRIRWTNAAGAVVSDSTNPVFPTYATVTGSWVRMSVTGIAPAGAYYGVPGVVVDDTTVTVGSSLYVDEPLFEQDSVLNDWAPGTGLRAVDILSLSETVPFDARWRKGMTLTLRELAT